MNSSKLNTKTFLLTLCMLPCMMLFSNYVDAQSLKIGFVNPQIILSRMPEAAAVQKRLENLAARKEQELIQVQQELQDAIQDLERTGSVISADKRTEKEGIINALREKLLNLQRDAETEIEQKRQEWIEPLIKKINDAIDVMSKEKGLDYVLNTTTSTGENIIIYVREQIRDEYDITDDVLTYLDI